MYKRLKVKLYPTKSQSKMLENHFDGYRFAYNLSLEYKQALWNYNRINISGFDLQKELFEIRCLQICGRHQVDKFKDFIYKDATVFLSRKKDKF